jgi:hypothetical protein
VSVQPNYCSGGWVLYYKVDEACSNFMSVSGSGVADDSPELVVAEQKWREWSDIVDRHFDTCAQCSAEQSRILGPIVSRMPQHSSSKIGHG